MTLAVNNPAPRAGVRHVGRDRWKRWVVGGSGSARILLGLWVATSVTYYWDEWPLAVQAREQAFLPFILGQENGYFVPLARILAWCMVWAAPFNGLFAAIMSLALLGIAYLVVWRLLKRRMGLTWASAALFVWFCWLPLFLLVGVWWSVAVSVLPALVLVACAFGLVDDGLGHSRFLWAGVLLAAALFFSPGALPGVVFVAGWTVLIAGGGRMGLLRLAIPVAVWLVTYLLLADRGVPFSPGVSIPAAVSESLAGTYVLGLVGGPWRWLEGPFPWFADTPSPLVFGVVICLVVGVWWVSRHGRGAPRILAPLGLALLVNVALLGWTAVGALGPDLLRQGRYWVALVVPTVLTISQVMRELGPWSRIVQRASLVLVGLTVLGSCVAGVGLGRQMQQVSAKAWLEQAQRSLSDHPGVVVWDGMVPDELISWVYWSDLARVSQALSPWWAGQRFNVGSVGPPWVFDGRGELVPGRLRPVAASAGPACFSLSEKGRTFELPVDVLLPGWVLMVGVVAQHDDKVTVTDQDRSQQLRVSAGYSEVFVPVLTPTERVRISGSPGTCVSLVAVGPVQAP